jgi:hypothetical protein
MDLDRSRLGSIDKTRWDAWQLSTNPLVRDSALGKLARSYNEDVGYLMRKLAEARDIAGSRATGPEEGEQP